MPQDTLSSGPQTICSSYEELVDWCRDHTIALQDAALALGGRAALARTQRLLARLPLSARLTVVIRREVEALLALLGLDYVDDPDSAAYFADIDPTDPVVDDICALTDGLRERLAAAATQGASARNK